MSALDWELIDPAELQRRLAGEQPPILLDVRLPEDFARGHLPGARQAAVLEVSFPQQVQAAGIGPGDAVVVYGFDRESYEARAAAEKLVRQGFDQVAEFREGLGGWVSSGAQVEGDATADAEAGEAGDEPRDGRWELDLAESWVGWLGRNLLNSHHGKIPIRSGWLELRGGQLVGGEVVAALGEMSCADLQGDAMHDVLIQHLLSEDFFDAQRFPEAVFSVKQSACIEDAGPGACNLRVEGELALRGVVRPMKVELASGVTPEGNLAAQGTVLLDRTDWGAIYGSGRFFKGLAGHLVNDLIELQLRVLTKAEA